MDDESGILFSKSIEDLLQNKAGYNDRAGTPRVALYSQDTLGYGHWRRNMLLAGALRECISAPSVLMIAGMHEAGAFELPDGVDSLTLPAYSKDSAGKYCARSLGLDLCELVSLVATAGPVG